MSFPSKNYTERECKDLYKPRGSEKGVSPPLERSKGGNCRAATAAELAEFEVAEGAESVALAASATEGSRAAQRREHSAFA